MSSLILAVDGIALALNTGMIPINLIRWHALRGSIVVMNRGTWYLNRVLKPYIVRVRYGLWRGALCVAVGYRGDHVPASESEFPDDDSDHRRRVYLRRDVTNPDTFATCNAMTLRRALTRIFIDLLRPAVRRDHWQTREYLGNNWSVRYAN